MGEKSPQDIWMTRHISMDRVNFHHQKIVKINTFHKIVVLQKINYRYSLIQQQKLCQKKFSNDQYYSYIMKSENVMHHHIDFKRPA